MSARVLPWRIVIGVLAAVIVVGAVLWFRPWERGGTVRFDYRAMFTYLGPEDGEPLENLTMRFPAPQIDNNFAGTIYSSWGLYYIGNDNDLVLQTTPAGIVNLQGIRSSQLDVYESGIENTVYGPALAWDIDKFYSREVFMTYGWTSVSREMANAVTLRSYSTLEDWSFGYWYTPEADSENWRVNFSFVVEMYRDNVLIEQYEVTWENQTWGAYALVKTI